MAREQSNFPGLKDPRRQSVLGRMADRDVLRAQKAAAWQALTDPQPQPEMTKIPSAKEFALNSRVAEANREEKPTGALALILRELPRFFKADDELADAMGGFSMRQGATATGGTILGLAAPAYLPLRTALARAATGVPLSVAGGWVMDPAAEKIFGSSVSDPLSDAVFGAMAGASGKIVTPMLSAIATSSGDAEAALGKVLRYAASKSDGNLTRPFKVHKTPFAAEAEFNLPGATRIRRTPEPLTESEGKAYEGMSVVPLLMDSGAERSVLRGDAINRITGERFAKGGLARIATRMGSDAAPARRGVSNVIKEKGGEIGDIEESFGGMRKEALKYLESLPKDVQSIIRNHQLGGNINESLFNARSGKVFVPSNEEALQALDEAFKNAPRFRKAQTLYRGTDPYDELMSSGTYPLYIPTSTSGRQAKAFADLWSDGQVHTILPTRETPFLVPFESFEKEVILPRGGKMDWVKSKANGEVFTYDRPFAKGGLARIATRMGSDAAPARRGVSNVIKEKGGNWLTGSVEDALGGLKRPLGQAHDRAMFTEEMLADPRIAREVALRDRESVLNSFIDKQLTRYVKNEMATPGDPIRALAERGVLHMPTDGAGMWTPEEVARRRRWTGNVEQGVAKSPLAQQWETAADYMIEPYSAGEIARSSHAVDNPWAVKLDPTARVFKADRDMATYGELGLPHLIDELSNALNPESGLPRHLLLDPKSMDRVSVPQAVERVSQINAWRAAQKAEADALRANNAATVLHKEYPDKGFRWVELRKPDKIDLSTVKHDPSWESPDEAFLTYQGGKQALQDALKYEGDTMGHCVGGYCDDVVSGRTKIYSLRDAKGEPHVTIEVRPHERQAEYDAEVKRRFERAINDGSFMYTDLLEMVPKDSRQKFLDEALAHGDWALADLKGNRAADVEQDVFDYLLEHGVGRSTATKKLLPSLTEGLDQPPAYIVQIKGKQNRAPNEEYLPFVQDFVRSGKWSDVGDLHNTGLMKLDDFKHGGMDPAFMEAARKELGDFPTMDELIVFKEKFDKGFAKGGLVQHPSGYLTKDELGKLVDEGDMDAIRLWQQSYIDR